MPSVAILPWLWIDHGITLNEFRLVPINRLQYMFETPDEGKLVCLVMSRYYEAQKAPLDRAVIAAKVGQPLTADLTGDEENLLFNYVELLACAGLSMRKFFSHGPYCNRDNFQLAIYKVSGANPGLSYSTWRRDGSVKHMAVKPRFDKPEHVEYGQAIDIDKPLLRALLAVYSTPLAPSWARIFEAIESFNLANTDSTNIRPHMELILLSNAFQRLLDEWKCEPLRQAFEQIFAPRTSISKLAGVCKWFADQNIQDEIQHARFGDWVRSVWMQDLCMTRNKMAHGEIEPSRNPIWSIRNHLLLASHVFPLLLKKYLVQNNLYTLTDDDQFDIDLFEQRACEDHFASSKHHPWNGVAATARLNQIFGQDPSTQLSASSILPIDL